MGIKMSFNDGDSKTNTLDETLELNTEPIDLDNVDLDNAEPIHSNKQSTAHT